MRYAESFYSSSLKCHMKQIDKRVARKAYDAGYTIWLQSSNLSFDNVWQNPIEVSKNGYSYCEYTFEQVYNFYAAFNCDAQRGRYIHFFIDKENYNRLTQKPQNVITMKQYDYKGVVIRPRLETFEQYHEAEINRYVELFKRGKADPEHHRGDYYDKSVEEYQAGLEKWLGSERLYWDTRSGSKWFVFFPSGRIVKMPYKKCTETWADFEARVDKVIVRVERESKGRYAAFSNLMQRIVSERIKNCSYLTYPTTYGFGLEAIFNWNFDKQAAEIEALLNEMGIDYTTEYSDHLWVFRYKISKAAENQNLIENLLKKSN